MLLSLPLAGALLVLYAGCTSSAVATSNERSCTNAEGGVCVSAGGATMIQLSSEEFKVEDAQIHKVTVQDKADEADAGTHKTSNEDKIVDATTRQKHDLHKKFVQGKDVDQEADKKQKENTHRMADSTKPVEADIGVDTLKKFVNGADVQLEEQHGAKDSHKEHDLRKHSVKDVDIDAPGKHSVL